MPRRKPTPSPSASPAVYIAYLRDSGGDHQELSTDQQLAALQRWAVETGAVITTAYTDQARPGSSTIGRDGFEALITHFTTGRPAETGVVVWKLSRFSRDPHDSAYFRAALRRLGFKFLSIGDNVPDNDMAPLYEAFIDLHNKKFLDDLSDDVKRALYDLVTKHNCVPGTPPRGFKRTPVDLGRHRDGSAHIVHRWDPDPDLIPSVQTAFAMRAAGKSLAEINAVTHLYGSINSYRTFFSNQLYIGILHFSDIVINDYCAPIIDQATWQQVQTLQAASAGRGGATHSKTVTHPRRATSPYLLTGIARCARCGSPLNGTDRKQLIYYCSNQKRTKQCDLQPIPTRIVDQIVLDQARLALTDPAYLAEIQRSLHADQANRLQNLAAQRSDMRQTLANTRRALTRLVATLEQTDNPPRSIVARIAELEKQEHEQLAQLDAIETDLAKAPPALSSSDLEQLTRRVHTALDRAAANPGQLQRMLRGVLRSVSVDRHGRSIQIHCTFYYPPDPDSPDPPDIMGFHPVENQVYVSSPRGGTPFVDMVFTITTMKTMRQYHKKTPA